MAAARHPQADGGLERVVQEVLIALRAYTTQKGRLVASPRRLAVRVRPRQALVDRLSARPAAFRLPAADTGRLRTRRLCRALAS